jgi:Matrixin
MKKMIPFATLTVLSCLLASSLFAYVLLSPRRTWDSPPNLIIDNRGLASVADGDLGRTATRNALLASVSWNGAGTGTRLSATIGSVSAFRMGDGRPMLVFRDPVGACTGNCLAATFTGFFASRGNGTNRITDADIVTNANGFNWASVGDACSGEIFVEGVMVHETGHLLGLGHSNVSGATMFPTVSNCNNGPASTAADDRAAINDLY